MNNEDRYEQLTITKLEIELDEARDALKATTLHIDPKTGRCIFCFCRAEHDDYCSYKVVCERTIEKGRPVKDIAIPDAAPSYEEKYMPHKEGKSKTYNGKWETVYGSLDRKLDEAPAYEAKIEGSAPPYETTIKYSVSDVDAFDKMSSPQYNNFGKVANKQDDEYAAYVDSMNKAEDRVDAITGWQYSTLNEEHKAISDDWGKPDEYIAGVGTNYTNKVMKIMDDAHKGDDKACKVEADPWMSAHEYLRAMKKEASTEGRLVEEEKERAPGGRFARAYPSSKKRISKNTPF